MGCDGGYSRCAGGKECGVFVGRVAARRVLSVAFTVC